MLPSSHAAVNPEKPGIRNPIVKTADYLPIKQREKYCFNNSFSQRACSMGDSNCASPVRLPFI
jgi:hypothetical protein